MKKLLETVKGRIFRTRIPEALRGAPREHIRLGNPWHAVSVEVGPRHCEAADGVAGHRFLSREAPAIPVPECTEATCTCRYQHHQDRRADHRRLDYNGAPPPHPMRRSSD